MNAKGNSICYNKCGSKNYKASMDEFLDFCSAYEDKMSKRRPRSFFIARLNAYNGVWTTPGLQRSCVQCIMEVKVVVHPLMID